MVAAEAETGIEAMAAAVTTPSASDRRAKVMLQLLLQPGAEPREHIRSDDLHQARRVGGRTAQDDAPSASRSNTSFTNSASRRAAVLSSHPATRVVTSSG